MPVFRPRTRLVNFRVNEEEYAVLRAACANYGARSISDFARISVLRSAMSEERQVAALGGRLALIGHQVTELECRVVQLLRLLEGGEK